MQLLTVQALGEIGAGEFGPKPVETDQIGAHPSRVWPAVGQIGQISAMPVELGKNCPGSANIGPTATEHGTKSTKLPRSRPRTRPELGVSLAAEIR